MPRATDQYLTVEQAANVLGVKPRTAYEYIQAGKIPAVRLSARKTRIPAAALHELLERQALANVASEANCVATTSAHTRTTPRIPALSRGRVERIA